MTALGDATSRFVRGSNAFFWKVVYMVGDREVDNFEGGEEIHFSRVISATGSSSYRLNGKEVPSCYKKCLRYLGYRADHRT